MNIKLVAAGASVALAALAPVATPIFHGSTTKQFACVAVKVAGAHIGDFAGITGPYASASVATTACNEDQKLMPTVNGTPVRWVTPTLNA